MINPTAGACVGRVGWICFAFHRVFLMLFTQMLFLMITVQEVKSTRPVMLQQSLTWNAFDTHQ